MWQTDWICFCGISGWQKKMSYCVAVMLPNTRADIDGTLGKKTTWQSVVSFTHKTSLVYKRRAIMGNTSHLKTIFKCHRDPGFFFFFWSPCCWEKVISFGQRCSFSSRKVTVWPNQTETDRNNPVEATMVLFPLIYIFHWFKFEQMILKQNHKLNH